ncbi:MAG: hypothetical protein MJ092_06580 [Lachnospiraceae bacterium]|nr:hypothetical protein [Lachnospiraceae bacterium]
MKKLFIVLVGIMVMGLFGCGQQKYNLELDGYGFSSKKTAYAEGDTVKVTYDMIATDTDYSFYLDCEDTKLNCDFENGAYVLTFKMPAHDVKLSVKSRNTMVYMPTVVITLENQAKTADIWIMEDTPEKRKQSVWGDPTIKACEVNEPREIELEVVSDDNLYIVRMIDEDGLFYEACNVEIEDGQSVVIKLQENHFDASVYVYDGDGSFVKEYEMFVAAL